jgi:DNA-binding response OmpR family regulator
MSDSGDTSSGMDTLQHVARVLIVEDTEELGKIIQIALKGMNVFSVHETRGTTALATYNSLRPDIVLLDIGLPDMTGWRLLDTIKESQTQGRRPAVVIISAFGDPANRLMGKLQGVYGYLIKPFTLDQVRDVVRRILAEQADDSLTGDSAETSGDHE